MPEERVRPSLLDFTTGPALSIISQLCESIGSEKEKNMLIRAVEQSLQDEMDEQLRILNEKGIKDRELRDMIISIRDDSYDAMAGQIEAMDEASQAKEQKNPLY